MRDLSLVQLSRISYASRWLVVLCTCTPTMTRHSGDHKKRDKLKWQFNGVANRDREKYYTANEAEESIIWNDLRPVFRSIKQLSGRGHGQHKCPIE